MSAPKSIFKLIITDESQSENHSAFIERLQNAHSKVQKCTPAQ